MPSDKKAAGCSEEAFARAFVTQAAAKANHHAYPWGTTACTFKHHKRLAGEMQAKLMRSIKSNYSEVYQTLWRLIKAYEHQDVYDEPLAGMIQACDGYSAQTEAIAKIQQTRPSRYWHTLLIQTSGIATGGV